MDLASTPVGKSDSKILYDLIYDFFLPGKITIFSSTSWRKHDISTWSNFRLYAIPIKTKPFDRARKTEYSYTVFTETYFQVPSKNSKIRVFSSNILPKLHIF